jgi:hypothetical protein
VAAVNQLDVLRARTMAQPAWHEDDPPYLGGAIAGGLYKEAQAVPTSVMTYTSSNLGLGT